jgi:hypothetical protein
MPIRTPTTSLNFASTAATMRSHAQISISAAEIALPCTEAMVILRRSRQRRVFSKKKWPLLQVCPLRDGRHGRAVRTEGRMLRGTGFALE